MLWSSLSLVPMISPFKFESVFSHTSIKQPSSSSRGHQAHPERLWAILAATVISSPQLPLTICPKPLMVLVETLNRNIIDNLTELPMENAQACSQGSAASSSAAGSSPREKHLPGSAQPSGLCKTPGQPGCPPSWNTMGVWVTTHGEAEGRHVLDHVSSTVL